MGKKKAKKDRESDEEPPDPKLLAMKLLITKEEKSRTKKQTVIKKALLPLKRVNSNPLIYEEIPIAKNLFPDSKSVDFGFEGVVDVPNQVYYKEEISDGAFDSSAVPFPDDISTSLSFMDSKELDQHEIDKLDKVKSHNSLHFLKTRVGKDNLENLLKNVKSPLLDLPATVGRGILGFSGPTFTKSGGRCRICILTFFLLIIILCGTISGLIYAGIQIPILTELLFPPNITQYNTTTIPIATTTATINATNDEGIDKNFIGAGGGVNSGEVYFRAKEEIDIVSAKIYEIKNKTVDVSWEYYTPPMFERGKMMMAMFHDVYEYLGFKLDLVIVDDIKPISSGHWVIQARIFGRAKYNLDIMRWYGFDGKTQRHSDYNKNLAKCVELVFKKLHHTKIECQYTFVGETLMDVVPKYMEKMGIRRPPAHIPFEWSDCTGYPACNE